MSNIQVMDVLNEERSRDETITIDDSSIPKPALNGAIYKGNLYLNLLNVPIGDLPKELFIKALDKAEEAGCQKVILCLDKLAHKEHIRTFMFLDFKLLPPNHPLVPSWDCSKNILFMGCDLEGGLI